ncbi:MAG: DUF1269 domain-containing protein [Geminicoccaceae bacterium]
MADLVAIVYPDEFRAAEVMLALRRMQKEYLVDLQDACVVTHGKADGKVKLEQAVNLTASGAMGGALWGTLVGLIFLNPLVGAAVGAAAGAIGGKLSDYGIRDDFMKELGEKMQPGSSAIFMMIRKATYDKVEPELAAFGGHVLYSNLSKDEEDKLNAILAGNPPAAAAPAA